MPLRLHSILCSGSAFCRNMCGICWRGCRLCGGRISCCMFQGSIKNFDTILLYLTIQWRLYANMQLTFTLSTHKLYETGCILNVNTVVTDLSTQGNQEVEFTILIIRNLKAVITIFLNEPAWWWWCSRGEEEKAASTCGHQEMAEATTTAIATATPRACGRSPSTPPLTTDARPCTMRVALPLWRPPSATDARGTPRPALWVCFCLTFMHI